MLSPLRRLLCSSTRVKLKGAYLNKKTGKWTSRITKDGKTTHLGTFETPEAASAAYHKAKSGVEGVPRAEAPSSTGKYIGVEFVAKTGKYEAVVETNDGTMISGGVYDSAEEAAKAYDAITRMYRGESAEVNFKSDAYAGWIAPDAKERVRTIEVKKGVPLTIEEVMTGLESENAIDPVVLNLKELHGGQAASLASYLVVCSGKSPSHMRRIGDMLIRSLRARRLRAPPEVGNFEVENRDGDDWMIVDTGSIVVNIMDPQARRVFALEERFQQDDDAQDAEQDMNQWVRNHPLPPDWEQRIVETDKRLSEEFDERA